MARSAHRFNRRRDLVNYPANPLPLTVTVYDPVFDLVFGGVDFQVDQETELLGDTSFDIVDGTGAVVATVHAVGVGGPSPSVSWPIIGTAVSGNTLVIPSFHPGLRGPSGEWLAAGRWTIP